MAVPEMRNAARQKFSFKLHFLVVTSLLGRGGVIRGGGDRSIQRGVE